MLPRPRFLIPPRVACLAALFAVLLASACSPLTDPFTDETSGPTPEMYRVDDLDLCSRTSLEPLVDLSLAVESRDSALSSTWNAVCSFKMRDPQGQPANLRVKADTFQMVEAAQMWYRMMAYHPQMRSEGQIVGIQEEAEAFSRESEAGHNSEYLIHAHAGNVVVEVHLTVGGKEFTQKAKMAAASRTILENTLALVPRA